MIGISDYMKFEFYKICLFLIFYLSTTLLLFSKNDTLDIRTKNIEVTSTRILSNSYLKFAPLSLIDKKMINQISPVQISEVLTMSPGIYIKDYGGLGGLKTISIRGTSASQTLIMINGMRLSSSQSGTLDLSILPVGLINSIEVLRSGMSAFYGSNAIGGVVNIITGYDNKFDISYKRGSFEENFVSLSSSKKIGDFNIAGFVEFKNSDGNFPFKVYHYGIEKEVNRTNGKFQSFSTAVTSRYLVDDFMLDGLFIISKTKRGVPGAVLQGYIESTSANLDESFISGLLSSNYLLNENSQLSTALSIKNNVYNYKDDSQIGINGLAYNSKFIGNDISFNSKIDINFLLNQQLGFELGFSDLSGEMLQPDAGDYVDRSSFSLNYKAEKNLKIKDFTDLLFLAGTRLDALQGFNPHLSSMIALINKFDFLPFNLKLQISNNFRAPSFNEMYYLNYGTKDLKPELSISYNTSVNYLYTDILDCEINLFYINTKDQIAAVPKSPVQWSAENTGKVITKGIEFNAVIHPFKNILSLNLAYTLQSALDKSENSLFYNNQVAYIPEETANAYFNYKILHFNIGVGIQYSSFRYALADNSYKSIMPEYYTLNLTFKYLFELEKQNLQAIFEIHNVTDNNFEVIKNYPMPDRFFRIGINFSIKDGNENKE
jgi:outer membrane cobalamin receptor